MVCKLLLATYLQYENVGNELELAETIVAVGRRVTSVRKVIRDIASDDGHLKTFDELDGFTDVVDGIWEDESCRRWIWAEGLDDKTPEANSVLW